MRAYLLTLDWSEVRIKGVQCHKTRKGEAVALVITSGFSLACDVDAQGLFRFAVEGVGTKHKRAAECTPTIQLLREGLAEVRGEVSKWPDGVIKNKVLGVFNVD